MAMACFRRGHLLRDLTRLSNSLIFGQAPRPRSLIGRWLTTKPLPAMNRVEKTMNNVTLLGRVGGDPQKRGTQEHPVVVFSLATHSNYQYDSGDLLQKTDWHRICIFKPFLRESVFRYVTKGQRVLVMGRVTYGEVKDEDGKSHVACSIIADDVIFFNKGPGGDVVPLEDSEKGSERAPA